MTRNAPSPAFNPTFPADDQARRWEALFDKPGVPALYPSEPALRWLFRGFPRDRAGETALLDLGSGSGRHALIMAREGYRTTALDFSGSAIAQLQGRAAAEGLAIDTRTGQADVLPFADASFDGVLCFAVLYYLPEARMAAAVREIRRVLKPGGRTLVMVKSDADSRRAHGREIAPHQYRLDSEPFPNSWAPELGMALTLLPRARLLALFEGFARVTLDRATMTSEDGALVADEWYVQAWRAP